MFVCVCVVCVCVHTVVWCSYINEGEWDKQFLCNIGGPVRYPISKRAQMQKQETDTVLICGVGYIGVWPFCTNTCIRMEHLYIRAFIVLDLQCDELIPLLSSFCSLSLSHPHHRRFCELLISSQKSIVDSVRSHCSGPFACSHLFSLKMCSPHCAAVSFYWVELKDQ